MMSNTTSDIHFHLSQTLIDVDVEKLFFSSPAVWNSLLMTELKLSNSINNFKHRVESAFFLET